MFQAPCNILHICTNVEICLAKAGASLTNLDIAEQQLVDCAYDGNSAMGCNGATMAVYPNFIAGKVPSTIDDWMEYF